MKGGWRLGNNIFKTDIPIRKGANATNNSKIPVKDEAEARAFANGFMNSQTGGQPLVRLPGNKVRTMDGRWQYRAKQDDVKQGHIHLERIDPKSGRVLENFHVEWQ